MLAGAVVTAGMAAMVLFGVAYGGLAPTLWAAPIIGVAPEDRVAPKVTVFGRATALGAATEVGAALAAGPAVPALVAAELNPGDKGGYFPGNMSLKRSSSRE